MKTTDDGATGTGSPRATPAGSSSRSALDWARDSGEAGEVIRDLEGYLLRRRRRRAAWTAGATMLLVLSAGAIWRTQLMMHSEEPATFVAASSGMEVQALSDGSVVELKSGAEIVVSMDREGRRVALRRGEAHFQVAPDTRRPFVVSAGGIAVRAVGTAFSVELGASAVDIVVTEGTVAVDNLASAVGTGLAREAAAAATPRPMPETTAAPAGRLRADTPLAVVKAGRRLVVDLAPGMAPKNVPEVRELSTEEIAHRLAWRTPRLEFSDTPLEEVIRLFNRHSAPDRNPRLVLGDPSLGRLQLSGVLRADNIEALQQLLAREFDIQSVQRGSEIMLQRGK